VAVVGVTVLLVLVFREADSTLLSGFVQLPDVCRDKRHDLERRSKDEWDLRGSQPNQ